VSLSSTVRSIAIALMAAASLAACGGGGASAAPEIPAPIARATVHNAYGQAAPLRQEEAWMYLVGSDSVDPNGHTLTYAWTLDERPAGSTRALLPATANGAPTDAVLPHTMRFDPDLPGNYTATLVVSNGITQGTLKVPFTVEPDAPWFTFPAGINLFQPNITLGSVYPRTAVVVSNIGSNYPWTVETFFNGVSQGVRSEGDLTTIVAAPRGFPGGFLGYPFPIGSFPAGDTTVRVVMRAGGASTEFTQQVSFPVDRTP
jgi:hypothetical protein